MRRFTAVSLMMGLLAATGALGAVDLTSINFPEKSGVDIPFVAEAGAPDAKVDAKVTYADGQASVQLKYSDMKPAILFGGDVTCYVVWAATRDGRAENLGELLASTPKGQMEFSTGKKSFALFVTAEPFYLVSQPSALVAFVGGAPKQKKIASTPFAFTTHGAKPAIAMDSIRDIAWESNEPLEILQARKAHELATRERAGEFAGSIYREAGKELGEAEALAEKKPNSKEARDMARQSVELSAEAMNITRQRIARMEFMAMMDARRAEMMAMEEKAAKAKAEVAKLEQQQKQLEATMVQLNRERVAAQQQAAKLGGLLGTALSKVADARNTAQGYVVSLPGILFASSKATLKRDAEAPLAKLAGIMLIMQGYDLRIQGHTDSTGSHDFNMKLSQERADSVMKYMTEAGLNPARMTAAGAGPDMPVADNDTNEGRQKNRRVEIHLTATQG